MLKNGASPVDKLAELINGASPVDKPAELINGASPVDKLAELHLDHNGVPRLSRQRSAAFSVSNYDFLRLCRTQRLGKFKH